MRALEMTATMLMSQRHHSTTANLLHLQRLVDVSQFLILNYIFLLSEELFLRLLLIVADMTVSFHHHPPSHSPTASKYQYQNIDLLINESF